MSEELEAALQPGMTQTEVTFTPAAHAQIAERIRELLRQRKITQRDFATAIAMPEGMLSKILTGTRRMTTGELERMATELGSSYNFLLGIEGETDGV